MNAEQMEVSNVVQQVLRQLTISLCAASRADPAVLPMYRRASAALGSLEQETLATLADLAEGLELLAEMGGAQSPGAFQ